MLASKRDKFLIKKARKLLEMASFNPDNSNTELHVFDFDETLAYTPDATYSIYFGYYLWKQPFQVADPDIVDQATALLASIGVKPYAIDEEDTPTGPTKVLRFDYESYERLRARVTRDWRQQILGEKLPKLSNGKWEKKLSIKYEFPPEQDRNAGDYVTLPGLEILREKLGAGHHVYICTARAGIENVKNIFEVLSSNGITLPTSRIFAVGGDPKGDKVAELIDLHNPKVVYFYDDSNRNIGSVRDICCKLVPELNLVKYSRTTPGAVDNTDTCGADQVDINENVNVFQRWRKLSGI